jgi:UDP-N-acetylglucosamine 2-epimerase
MSVVGRCPNFMKIVPIVQNLRKFTDLQHCLAHTGQHYDGLLSRSLFRDLSTPRPDVNLEGGPGTHIAQTVEVVNRLEPVLLGYPYVVLGILRQQWLWAPSA